MKTWEETRRRQIEAEGAHLEKYPDHLILTEVGRTLCADCDAYVWRETGLLTRGWRRIKRFVRARLPW